MGSIKVLSAEVAGRIAAGEVIERPASVLKELVENSIDAGATRIRVNSEQGGQKLLQVIDNGCGMDRQDAMLCLEAHATSKIREESDVGQIHTLGFRGEALPSISSVSRFLLQTRTADSLTGTEIIVNYGKIENISDCGCAPGCNIKVSHLFGNLPARRKFLKGPATEDSHIEETMRLLALSRPDIAFELHLNGRAALQVTAAQDIAARTAMLLGKDAFAAMLPVNYSEDGLHIYGYISKPGFTRNNRREQRIIVNGRAATADTVYFAIRDTYDTLILKGRYPSVVLYLDLAPERVDVNVHPTKHEVRFREPMRIANIISAALRQALRGLPGGAELQSAVPSPPPLSSSAPAAGSHSSASGGTLPVAGPPSAAAWQAPALQPALPLSLPPSPRSALSQLETPSPDSVSPELPEAAAPDSSAGLSSMSIKGILGTRHLLAEGPGGLVIVDLRAARQRIIFEKLLKNLQNSKVERQQLLLPLTLNLSPEESKFLAGSLAHFQSLGFYLEPFGGNTYIITAVPASLPGQDYASILRDIIDDMRTSNLTNRQNAIHLAQIACRHAVRSTAVPNADEQKYILQELIHCEMPYTCPNGNPTMVHITYSELEKRFKA